MRNTKKQATKATKATKQLPATTTTTNAIVPVPVVRETELQQVTASIAQATTVMGMRTAKTLAVGVYGENAVCYEVGELKCIGVKAETYPTVTVTNWKKWCNNVPEVGNVVRWGSGETWEVAVKTAHFKRALEAHTRAMENAKAAAAAKKVA